MKLNIKIKEDVLEYITIKEITKKNNILLKVIFTICYQKLQLIIYKIKIVIHHQFDRWSFLYHFLDHL